MLNKTERKKRYRLLVTLVQLWLQSDEIRIQIRKQKRKKVKEKNRFDRAVGDTFGYGLR